jgi:hypothetical protein
MGMRVGVLELMGPQQAIKRQQFQVGRCFSGWKAGIEERIKTGRPLIKRHCANKYGFNLPM